jgi:hypothetical protein
MDVRFNLNKELSKPARLNKGTCIYDDQERVDTSNYSHLGTLGKNWDECACYLQK